MINWNLLGEVMRFILALCWIAVGFALGVKLANYAIKVYEERIRWWR